MMSFWDHLVIVPIVLPLATGALTLLIEERRYLAKGVISLASIVLLLAAEVALMAAADAGPARVYRLGDWPAPFGIVLVADRLAAAMVLLVGVLGFAAMIFSLARWHRAGPRFHALLQFLLMGLNGVVIKAHGSARERAIMNAIRVAAEEIRHDVNAKIAAEIARANAKLTANPAPNPIPA